MIQSKQNGHSIVIDGNMKWNTKAEAEKAAEWFIYTKLQFKRYNE